MPEENSHFTHPLLKGFAKAVGSESVNHQVNSYITFNSCLKCFENSLARFIFIKNVHLEINNLLRMMNQFFKSSKILFPAMENVNLSVLVFSLSHISSYSWK